MGKSQLPLGLLATAHFIIQFKLLTAECNGMLHLLMPELPKTVD
jgi:hypothetical protein